MNRPSRRASTFFLRAADRRREATVESTRQSRLAPIAGRADPVRVSHSNWKTTKSHVASSVAGCGPVVDRAGADAFRRWLARAGRCLALR